MTLQNAIKKLEKATGQKIQVNSVSQHYVEFNGRIISFYPNGRTEPTAEIICIHTKRVGEESDSQSDYFPGTFWENLSKAIRHASRPI